MTATTPNRQPTTSTANTLATITERILPLLPPEERTRIREAVDRAQAGRARVLVVGEAKRGKSTLVNALFGRPLLPTGALPLTSVACAVTVADREAADVRYLDGRVAPIGLGDVEGLVSQRGNPDNARRVDRVRVLAPSPSLPAGTEVVDTPGTGSVHEANTAESRRAGATVDLAVLVVAADPPVSAAELALLSEVLRTAAAVAIVVNKTDLVDAADLAEIVEFTRTTARTALGADVPVFATSLRADPARGLPDLVAWLTARLAARGTEDVVASTARAVRRAATDVLDGLRVAQRLQRHSEQQRTDAVQALRDILDGAAASVTAATDHVRGRHRRARTLLDERYEHEAAALRRAARAEVDRPGRDTPERDATATRGRIGELVVTRCTAWFEHVAPELDGMLRLAADRALAELGDQLAAARRSAEDVLALRLAEIEPPPPSPPPALPGLRFSEEAQWRELISSTVARHLPEPLRRRRSRRHLLDWADDTAGRPLGRARSGLQSWLVQTTRGIERDLDATWRTHVAALRSGLATVDDSSAETPTADRIADVESVLRDLDSLLTAVS